jgi:hypothetical protein
MFYLTYYLPKLYTKDGRISKISNDLSNIEKILIDCICSEKVNEHTPNLNLNDAFIGDLISKKRSTKEEAHVVVKVAIRDGLL